MYRITAFLFSIFTITMTVQAQPLGKTYLIDKYLVDPIAKIISVYTYKSGIEADGTDWWGYTYTPDTTLDYDSIYLDIHKGEVAFVKLGTESYTSSPVYKPLSDVLFQGQDGERCFVSSPSNKMTPILPASFSPLDLDLPTLKHIFENYYYDKHGLYHFGEENLHAQGGKVHSMMLQKTGGNLIEPQTIGTWYFVYNNILYPDQIPVEGDVTEFVLDDHERKRLLTDGVQMLYKYKNYSFDKIDTKSKDSNKWVQLYRTVFATSDGFCQFDEKTKTFEKLEDVHVFNADTQQREPIDVGACKYIGKDFYIYKQQLYKLDFQVTDTLKLDSLRFIEYNNVLTDWLTDGNLLINTANNRYRGTRGIDAVVVYENNRAKIAGQLRILRKDLLMDDENIYYCYGSNLYISPLKELGFEVIAW